MRQYPKVVFSLKHTVERPGSTFSIYKDEEKQMSQMVSCFLLGFPLSLVWMRA